MQWACDSLNHAGIEVSLFIDPELAQIDAAVEVGAAVVELHTGCYADAKNPLQQREELERLKAAALYANSAGLQVNAGHGLNFYNVAAICAIPEIVELNIGHAIISQALFSGLSQAVKDLKHIMRQARAEAYYLSQTE
jgi:pyridoxine 5-phosphate synthase